VNHVDRDRKQLGPGRPRSAGGFKNLEKGGVRARHKYASVPAFTEKRGGVAKGGI